MFVIVEFLTSSALYRLFCEQRLPHTAPARGEPFIESDFGVPRVVATAWRHSMFDREETFYTPALS